MNLLRVVVKEGRGGERGVGGVSRAPLRLKFLCSHSFSFILNSLSIFGSLLG